MITLSERDSFPSTFGHCTRYWADETVSENVRFESGPDIMCPIYMVSQSAHHALSGITLKADSALRKAFDLAYNLTTNNLLVWNDAYFNNYNKEDDILYMYVDRQRMKLPWLMSYTPNFARPKITRVHQTSIKITAPSPTLLPVKE